MPATVESRQCIKHVHVRAVPGCHLPVLCAGGTACTTWCRAPTAVPESRLAPPGGPGRRCTCVAQALQCSHHAHSRPTPAQPTASSDAAAAAAMQQQQQPCKSSSTVLSLARRRAEVAWAGIGSAQGQVATSLPSPVQIDDTVQAMSVQHWLPTGCCSHGAGQQLTLPLSAAR